MKCALCTMEMDDITTSFKSKWGDYEVTIDGIKAHQCKQCQRVVFDPEVARMIQNISVGFSEIQPDERPDLINVDDVADLLSISNQTVYNMIKDGRLKATKVGREWRFSRQHIEDLIKPGEEAATFSLAARNYDGLSVKDHVTVERYLEKLRCREQQKGRKI
ncbi:MAG: helix-turn-helix domain-containing protein [Bacillota bacterium]|nr:helix-turn-helix domain-containing protein [Bacillota bacterium]